MVAIKTQLQSSAMFNLGFTFQQLCTIWTVDILLELVLPREGIIRQSIVFKVHCKTCNTTPPHILRPIPDSRAQSHKWEGTAPQRPKGKSFRTSWTHWKPINNLTLDTVPQPEIYLIFSCYICPPSSKKKDKISSYLLSRDWNFTFSTWLHKSEEARGRFFLSLSSVVLQLYLTQGRGNNRWEKLGFLSVLNGNKKRGGTAIARGLIVIILKVGI